MYSSSTEAPWVDRVTDSHFDQAEVVIEFRYRRGLIVRQAYIVGVEGPPVDVVLVDDMPTMDDLNEATIDLMGIGDH